MTWSHDPVVPTTVPHYYYSSTTHWSQEHQFLDMDTRASSSWLQGIYTLLHHAVYDAILFTVFAISSSSSSSFRFKPSPRHFLRWTHQHIHSPYIYTCHVLCGASLSQCFAQKTHKPYAGRYDASVVCGRACVHFVRKQQKLSNVYTHIHTQYDNLSLKIVSLKYFTKYTHKTRARHAYTLIRYVL